MFLLNDKIMIHKLIIALVMAVCTLVPRDAFSQSVSESADTIIVASCQGNYSGLMDVEMGKGKIHEGRPATFTIKDSVLFCDFPKIGKMPGKITIELLVKIHKDGQITAEPESVAGVMKMPLGFKFKLKLDSLKEARIDANKLSFTLTVYGQSMGTKFPTTIYFRGER